MFSTYVRFNQATLMRDPTASNRSKIVGAQHPSLACLNWWRFATFRLPMMPWRVSRDSRLKGPGLERLHTPGERRPRPETHHGRIQQFQAARPNGRSRRVAPIASHAGDGPFTEPIAVGQDWRQELVFMPHSCRPRAFIGLANVGGNRTSP